MRSSTSSEVSAAWWTCVPPQAPGVKSSPTSWELKWVEKLFIKILFTGVTSDSLCWSRRKKLFLSIRRYSQSTFIIHGSVLFNLQNLPDYVCLWQPLSNLGELHTAASLRDSLYITFNSSICWNLSLEFIFQTLSLSRYFNKTEPFQFKKVLVTWESSRKVWN